MFYLLIELALDKMISSFSNLDNTYQSSQLFAKLTEQLVLLLSGVVEKIHKLIEMIFLCQPTLKLNSEH